jgi:HSP20 family molecular chaperone IbpA
MDGVKAKLENGLLRIVVPKVVFRMRRIEVR